MFSQPENSNGHCVSTVFVARALYRLVDSGSDSSWKRRVCSETQSSSDKCNAAIVPQRLHGSLLKRSDRRRARPELSEAKPRKSFARMPNRRKSDCPGIATGSRVDCFSESSGPPAPAPSMSTPGMSAPAAPPTATAQPSAAGAGRPSQAQLRSVRQSCGADYRVHCAGILPGGSASIACLKRNITTLSGQCKQALGAVAAGATTAAAPAVAPPPVEPAPLLVSPREELFILRMACGGDYAAFCRGLRPGAGRIAACLHYNSASLSPRCQQALTALREGR